MTAAEIELTDEQYHRHPALSASGAKLLLPPNCAAIYRYRADNPPEPKDVFDFGSAAHTLVLGKGAPLVDVAFDAWTTADAKKARDDARAAGAIPLRSQDYAAVHAMAKALREHPIASALLTGGTAEQKLFWTDEETGVPLRAMLDYQRQATGRLLISDYKTTASAAPERFSRSLADLGYHVQDAFYQDAARAAELSEEVAFLLIAQEKEPPYLVSVYEPDEEAVQIGRQLMRQAIDIYQTCSESGFWPGYSTDIERIGVPSWYSRRHEEVASW